jgi:CRISPR system Cascade subunit CasD
VRFLVFRLYGPLASWGEVAVGEVRPTDLQPSRSAMLGLLGAALGFRRDDHRHAELGAGLFFAVRVDRVGAPLVDYHTVQTMPPRRGRIFLTRAEQLRGFRHELATIVSRRHYRMDAAYTIAIWQNVKGPEVRLEMLAQALEFPVFLLYLGRKSCPPAHPLAPRVLEAETVVAAMRAGDALLMNVAGDACVWPPLAPASEHPRWLSWEGRADIAGVTPALVAARRDDPVSRTGWRFRVRRQYSAPFPEEVEDVSQPHHAAP